MKSYTVKQDVENYTNILNGVKPFIVIEDFEPYEEGDVIHLREYGEDDYTGRQSLYVVTYAEEAPDGHIVMSIKPWSPCNWKVKGIGSYYAIDKKDRLLAKVFQTGELPNDKWKVEVLNEHIETLKDPHKAKLIAELSLFGKGMYDHE